MLKKLWLDEGGAVLTAELILLLVLVVIGLGLGMVMLRDAMVAELSEVASAIASINATYDFGNLVWDGPLGGENIDGDIKGIGTSSYEDVLDVVDYGPETLTQTTLGLDLDTEKDL